MYSVLMSVYYKEKPEYLQQAMDSMWNQSIPTDDFVLVCDGPLGNELNTVISDMQQLHPELRVIRLDKNVGLGNALNEGLKYCRNELVARMDSDDISLPQRCEKELAVLATHPEIGIVSCTVREFCDNELRGTRILPEMPEDIARFSRKRNPFSHPSVMFRKSEVLGAGAYCERYHLFEDYDLWIRMLMNGTNGMNLPDVLLHMRVSMDMYERRGGIRYAADMLRFHNWMRKTGWSSWPIFLTGALPHAIVCVLPKQMRKMVYTALRKG